MNEETLFRFKTMVLFCLALISGLAAVTYIDRMLSGSVSQELQIATNIGEIERLDEVLTMSSRMYTVSEDESYRQRYDVHSLKLDALIADTFELINDPESVNFLNKTDAANQQLIKIELEAIELCQQGLCKQGYDLLQQQEYINHKLVYKEGIHDALQHLRLTSRSLTQGIKNIFIITVGLLILISIAFIYYRHIQHENKKQQDIDDAKHEALVIIMSTVMDTFGNSLNNLLLFRLKMEESSDFNEDDLQEFDRIIDEANKKLLAMGNMPAFKEKKGSIRNELDYSSSQEA